MVAFYKKSNGTFEPIREPVVYASGGSQNTGGWETGVLATKFVVNSPVYAFANWPLSTLPPLEFVGAKDFRYTFFGSKITEGPEIPSGATSMRGMFWSCSNLVSVPAYQTLGVTDFTNMFRNCTSLEAIPSMDMRDGTATDFAPQNGVLKSIYASNFRDSLNVSGNQMDAVALNVMFNRAGEARSPGFTKFTVTGNPGAASCNKAIAEEKGWVVVT